jgi:hypothetical protein
VGFVWQNVEIWEYGWVKTTLQIPDDLFRAAKAKAAMEGRKLKDIVTEGLRLAVKPSSTPQPKRIKLPLIAAKGKRKLQIPDDVASRVVLLEDLERHESAR